MDKRPSVIHTLTICYSKPLIGHAVELDYQIRFARNLEPEYLAIRGKTASLTFIRSRRETSERAFANQRHRQVLDRLAGLYALQSFRVPVVVSYRLNSKGNTEPLDIPKLDFTGKKPVSPLLKIEGLHINPVSQVALSPLLEGTETGKVILVSASNLIASYYSGQEISRFRLLWSSLNSLYNFISRSSRTERERLKDFYQYLGRLPLNRTLNYWNSCNLDELITELNWYGYLFNRMSRLKSPKPSIVDEYFEQLDLPLYTSIVKLLSSREALNKSGFLELLEERFEASGGLGVSPLDEIRFIVTEYLYNYRCRIFHGETQTKLYTMPQECLHLAELNNLLECLILDVIEACGYADWKDIK